MDKQELIERIEDFPCEASLVTEMIRINKNTLLGWVKELDEPQKVQVPQFVADWIEKNRGSLFGLNYDSVSSEIYDWVYEEEEEEGNLKKLHLACAIGYTVEKEKQYLVKMKGIEGHNSYLKYNKNLKHWYFGSLFIYNNDVDTRTYHTRKELEEAGFGWVFDCPGIEIEEVEG